MEPQALSQEEVDALRAAPVDADAGSAAGAGASANTDTYADADAPPHEDARGVRDYDLASQERIVRGRMPALDIVNERFARNFRIGLFNFMQRSPDVSAGPVKVQKFSAFLRGVALPSNINVVHVRPLRGAGLLICDPALVFAVIDSLFGGAGLRTAQTEGREFSATEQRIIVRLVEVIAAEYAKSWSGIHPIELDYARSEMHPQFANIAKPGEIVVTTTFQVALGDTGGAMHLCIPYATFEPIRDILHAPPPGDNGAPDRHWLALLTQQIKSASVEVAAEFAQGRATVRELLALKAGDFIALDREATLLAKVDGVPVFECDYGTLGAHYGLRIREFLTPVSAPTPGLPAVTRN